MDLDSILSQMQISADDLRDLNTKFAAFYGSLNAAQKAGFDAARPSVGLESSAAALNYGVTSENLNTLLTGAVGDVQPATALVVWGPLPNA